MRRIILTAAAFITGGWGVAASVLAADGNILLGSRPLYLVEDMDAGPLKVALQHCAAGPVTRSDFSIGHRGAPLQFPEHTKQSYEAAARMGAGLIECDVTFTKDRQLVCRHSQCDLHTTTNILATPLAAKCTQPFVPADPDIGLKASAKCCTSDVTLAEFRTLCGKKDASDKSATTVEVYVKGTADCATLMTHGESIDLFKRLGVKFIPELKAPGVTMPFEGDYTQEVYAQQMIDAYKAAGVNPGHVYAQSFDLDDILYWIDREPAFGKQAVYLDKRVYKPAGYRTAVAGMKGLADKGVRIIAPPLSALVKLDAAKQIVASDYAVAANEAGLDTLTWTLERSGPLKNGGGWYYQTIRDAIDNDGDTYTMLDALAQKVGVKGVFSDWPATVTYYANCKGL